VAASPGFSRCEVGAGKGISAHHLRGLCRFGVTRRIDQGNGGSARFAEVGIARGGFAVQRQAQDLAFGLVWILGGGVKRWRSPTVRNRYWPSGEKAICLPPWPPLPLGIWRHKTSKFPQPSRERVGMQLSASQR